MRIYLSLPMTGRNIAEIEKQIAMCKSQLETERPGSTITTPLDACDGELQYSKCMGRDITALLENDAVCMCPGWEASRGCNLEYEAAKIYDKTLLFL